MYQSTPREPELLTHREDEVEVELEPFYDDEYDEELTEEEARAVRRKKVWRRVRRSTYIAFGLMLLAPVVAFAVAYQVAEVPIPEDVAAKQGKAITIYYADGSEMSKIAPDGANRTMVKYEEIPDVIKRAVFAAEDPTFETNPGFDMTAIARAAWYQVTDRDSGGSGLTQQYVKKATEQADNTLTRKFNEMVTSYKMSEQQKKEDILTAYLNTIYFGRSAYGIKTAAWEYFGVDDLNKVTPTQAALLAGMIQNPSNSEIATYRQDRWDYVMKQLLKYNWIDQAYVDAQQGQAPVPINRDEKSGLSGVRLHIREQVLQEMARVGWDQEKAQKVGVSVYTTIDPPMQQAAEEAVDEVMKGQREELRTSMSAIDPATGAVKAYWAGENNGIDYQRGTLQEPGSSFKPFDFVAALQVGEGPGEVYDGSSPRDFPGRTGDNAVRNSPGVKCNVPKQCSVREAMVKSVNTVFFDMAIKLGTGKVAEAAFQAGIPREIQMDGTTRKLLVSENGGAPDGNISIGGGQTLIRPFDLTSAYATFAARGVYHEPFFITKITNSEGKAVHQHIDVTRPAFDPDLQKSQDIADNVTDVLKAIPGSSRIPCAGNRECAGKTGTHELQGSTKNAKAWMAGYTPTLAASVWLGTDAGNVPLLAPDGRTDIYGSGVPGQIWKKFMDKALNGAPMEKFPKPKTIGKYDEPKITTTTPSTTTPSRDNDNGRTTTSEPTTTTGRVTTTPPTRTTRPCTGLVCPTTPSTSEEEQQPDPIGNGSPPNG